MEVKEETKDEITKMRKRNMKLFPIYKMFAWDYLFFYTIDFLFLTQVKNISAADVVLKTTIYALFGIVLQIPANITIEFLGRKNSLVLANILNCIYMVILMLSRNLYDLIFAEFFASMAFSIKNIVETNMLSESIPPSKYKSKIFSKLNSIGASRYYIINSISKVISGFLFKINGYLPIIISFIVLIGDVILSLFFIDPIEINKRKIKTNLGGKEIKDIKEGFKFVLKSERLKALILSCALIKSLLSIMSNYSTSILQDIGISSVAIGIISAMMGALSAIASRGQGKIHKKLKNKTLITLSLLLSISCILGGISGVGVEKIQFLSAIVITVVLIYGFVNGAYYTISDKYLGNFSNKYIDTKIYTINSLACNIARVIGGFFAAFLLERISTGYAMIVLGIVFTIIYLLISSYMKKRLGLKPEEYSEEEKKYDELKGLNELKKEKEPERGIYIENSK